MAKDKLSKYLKIIAICCILIGLYPSAKGEGKVVEEQRIEIMEFRLGLVFDPLCKYSHYKDANGAVNSKVEFGFLSWSSLSLLLGIILLRYRKRNLL
ncbi:MAG: hypothetical protein KAG34_00115 [Cocleimonas sp.]|nr:hypothetical protein [Cocleimonas sp.]